MPYNAHKITTVRLVITYLTILINGLIWLDESKRHKRVKREKKRKEEEKNEKMMRKRKARITFWLGREARSSTSTPSCVSFVLNRPGRWRMEMENALHTPGVTECVLCTLLMGTT